MAKNQRQEQQSKGLGELAVNNRQLNAHIDRQSPKQKSPKVEVDKNVTSEQKNQRLHLIAKGLNSIYGERQSPKKTTEFQIRF